MTRHVLDIDDLTAAELVEVLDLAGLPASALPPTLEGRGVALVFEKPSARTRNSSEMAVVALGGHPVTIAGVRAASVVVGSFIDRWLFFRDASHSSRVWFADQLFASGRSAQVRS